MARRMATRTSSSSRSPTPREHDSGLGYHDRPEDDPQFTWRAKTCLGSADPGRRGHEPGGAANEKSICTVGACNFGK